MPAIRSTRVVAGEDTVPATVFFQDGTITRVAAHHEAPAEVIDYGTLVVMPGIVDSHVHVNEPGRTEWEGFASATRAAAAGGVTTIVDMPLNSIPPTTTVDALYEKAHAAEGQCRVDFALWGGVIPGNRFELRAMLGEGARGFKCFLSDSGVDEFPRVAESDLRAAAAELAQTGAPLLVHAELPDALRPPTGDAAEYASWLASRPADAEDRAIELLARVSAESRAWIHVVHLSSAGALDTLRRAQAAGVRLTAETTPHYLHFEAERIAPHRSEFKCAPPIRGRSNRERLWQGVESGIITAVVSDHSPCSPALKRGDFMTAWGGISSLQLILPVVWTEAARRGRTIGEVARWLCEAPSRLARLPGKGRIAAGNDADFAVFDPDARFLVEPDKLEHRHKVTPYAGEELRGAVRATWLRGSMVFTDGTHVGPPAGRWLR